MTADTFVAILASCLVASVAHEATHYAVARAARRRPRFDINEWAVYWHAPADAPRQADYAVALAPVVLGVLAAVVSAILWGIAWWLIPAWYLYSLHGAITNDLDFNPQTDTGAV